MGRIILWKGHHSPAFAKLFRETWNTADQLLIACPPVLQDFSFLDQLPAGEVFFAGDWQLPLPANTKRSGARGYPESPSFGVFTTGYKTTFLIEPGEVSVVTSEGEKCAFDVETMKCVI